MLFCGCCTPCATAREVAGSTDSLFLATDDSTFLSAEGCIDFILSQVDNDEDRQLMGEKLRRLADNPLDLNTATHEQLAELPFVDDFFLRNLLLYRSQRGPFYTVYDLKGVQGAPLAKLPFIAPFITVTHDERASARRHTFTHLQSSGQEGDHAFLWRLESQKDWGWSASIVGEKDCNEKLLSLKQGVLDHWALNLNHHGKSGETEWLAHLGDYRVTTGRGLAMGMSYSYFSGLEMGNLQSTLWQKTIKAHRSQREYVFLRGMTATVKHGAFSFTPFIGWEMLDARIENDRIMTLYFTGQHRDARELHRRHNALRRAIGAYVTYENTVAHVGLLGVHHAYNSTSFKTLQPSLPAYLALDWELLGNKIKWIGEVAWGLKDLRHSAAIVGFALAPKQSARITVLGRHLGLEHNAPYRRPDSRFSTGRNEYGLKLLWEQELGYNLTGLIYTDFYKSIKPEARRRSNQGNISSIRLNHFNNGVLSAVVLRSMITDKEKSVSLRGTTQLPLGGSEWLLKPSARVNKQLGVAGLTYATALRAKYETINFRTEFGAQYFSCEQGMIRAEEPYMPYVYYVPMLRRKGVHLSAMSRYDFTQKLYIAARAVHTFYTSAPEHPLPFSYHISLNLKL